MVWLALFTGIISLISIFGIFAPNELDKETLKFTAFPRDKKE
jgi:hypothetical protein